MTGHADSYTVGLTPDCRYDDGQTLWGDLHLERLDAAGVGWRLLDGLTAPIRPELLDGLDAVISFGHLPFSAKLVRELPRLRHVARFGAGYDGIDVAGLAAEGVVVTTTPQAVRLPLALSAVTLLMASAHRLVENHGVTQAGRWTDERGRYRGLGLPGRTVGIVGFGSVGAAVAEILLGMCVGVTVLAVDRPSTRGRARAMGLETVSLRELAERSDYVVATASLTDESYQMFDAHFFGAMQPHAYFINVGRGALVVQPALTEALAEGRIGGAALDVFDPEPVAADDPLLAMRNVTVTPHALAWTADFTDAVATSTLDAVITASRGEVPGTALLPVDPAAWRGARGRLNPPGR
jgi:phosphoglycerate dehydrogenase-like enzyme